MFRYCSRARTRNDALLAVPGTQYVFAVKRAAAPKERAELHIVSPELLSETA